MMQERYTNHYENSTVITSTPESIFAYADNHNNFSSHMNQSSWMMGGGKMETETDEGKGQRVGSHIKMAGRVFGINLFLDEVITQHDPPFKKAWETVGKINLLIMDHYQLGFEINPNKDSSNLRVYIDYNLSQSWKTYWLGYLFSGMYAKWCVGQMINGVKEHFK